jgi:hypothetical protein
MAQWMIHYLSKIFGTNGTFPSKKCVLINVLFWRLNNFPGLRAKVRDIFRRVCKQCWLFCRRERRINEFKSILFKNGLNPDKTWKEQSNRYDQYLRTIDTYFSCLMVLQQPSLVVSLIEIRSTVAFDMLLTKEREGGGEEGGLRDCKLTGEKSAKLQLTRNTGQGSW